MRPHYEHSSRENATPSSGTSLLASCKGVPPPLPPGAIGFPDTYPLDKDLFSGKCYSPFEQPAPAVDKLLG